MSGKLGFVSRLARQNARFFTTSKSKCSPLSKEEFQAKQRLLQADEREIHMKLKQRVLADSVRKHILKSKMLRLSNTKTEGPPPPCAEPVQPCCPTSEEPPPCPPPPPPCGPPCPPPRCVLIPDPNNPCNYVPPEDPNSSEPDLTKLKKRQCHYQTNPDIPFYLRGGKADVYLFQGITILGAFLLLHHIYFWWKMINM